MIKDSQTMFYLKFSGHMETYSFEEIDIKYTEFVENFLVYLGFKPSRDNLRSWECNFGGPKLSLTVDQPLLDYISRIGENFSILEEIFTADVMTKWETLNCLILNKYNMASGLKHIEHWHALAALTGFALLENISQKISQKWDAQGKTLELLNKAHYGISREYKKGDFISSFKDKMRIMIHCLPEFSRTEWNSLDKLTRRPDLQNGEESASLFDRLHIRRNAWAHGEEFEGKEGITATLILVFLYIQICVIGINRTDNL